MRKLAGTVELDRRLILATEIAAGILTVAMVDTNGDSHPAAIGVVDDVATQMAQLCTLFDPAAK